MFGQRRPSTSVNATITFRLPYRLEREGNVWVAACDALDVASQGRDRNEAGRMLVEALQLFLEGCIEDGNLDAVLRECWFEPTGARATPADAAGDDYLDVPVSLIAAG